MLEIIYHRNAHPSDFASTYSAHQQWLDPTTACSASSDPIISLLDKTQHITQVGSELPKKTVGWARGGTKVPHCIQSAPIISLVRVSEKPARNQRQKTRSPPRQVCITGVQHGLWFSTKSLASCQPTAKWCLASSPTDIMFWKWT